MSVVQVRHKAKNSAVGTEPVLPNRPFAFYDLEIELALLPEDVAARDEARRAKLHDHEPYIGVPALPKPPPWWRFAACRDMDPAVFFTVGRPNVLAVKACQSCTVREPCLEQALIEDAGNKDSFGYRGGLGPAERKKLRTYANSRLAQIRAENEEIRRKFVEMHRPTADRAIIVRKLAGEYGKALATVKKLVNDLA